MTKIFHVVIEKHFWSMTEIFSNNNWTFLWEVTKNFRIIRTLVGIEPPSIGQPKFFGQWSNLFLSSDRYCFEAQPKTFLAKEQILSRFGNWKLATKCFWAMIMFFQSLDEWCKSNHHQSNNWKFWVTNKK